jgi:hypothetical protein
MNIGVWGAASLLGVAMAAEAVKAQVGVVIAPRTVDDLPVLAWAFLIGWAFAGWVIASLKPAVIAMNDPAQTRSVVVAGIISTLTASLAFGVGCGLYLLTEARWDSKPLAALYAYLGALGGGFWGMRGMEFVIDIIRAVLASWARTKAPPSIHEKGET